MTIKDIGPAPQAFDLETATVENPNYSWLTTWRCVGRTPFESST